jgi:hypothetical protein
MKKYTVLLSTLLLIVIVYELIYQGKVFKISKNDIFYNELLQLGKNNVWKMLMLRTERIEPFYKEIFEISSFDIRNIKKIDINLYTPKEWPSKNLVAYALSPGGKEIVFAISERDGAFNLVYSLYILNIMDGNIRIILSPQQSTEITKVCYFPDEKNIFFVGKVKKPKEAPNISQPDSLYKLNLKTKEITELIHYGVFTITSQSSSPNGKKIVYQKSSNLDKIFIYDLTTNESSKLTDGNYASWRPDGLKISYYGQDGNYYLINADGSEKELFILNKPIHKFKLIGAKIGYISGELLWSPEGQYVYYERTSIKAFADVETYLPYIMKVSSKEERKLSNMLSGIKNWVGENKYK